MTLKELLLSLNIPEERLKELKNLKKYIKQEEKEEIINTFFQELKALKRTGYYNNNYIKTFKTTISEFIDIILSGDTKIIESEIKKLVGIHQNRKTEDFLKGYMSFINLLLGKIKVPPEETKNVNILIIILFAVLFALADTKSNKEIDNITKLDSKNIFFEKFYEIITKTNSIVLIDINEFKNINIYYGFKTGNSVLSIFSGLLKSRFPGAFITRIQNDEFLLLTKETCKNTYRKLRDLQDYLITHPPNIPTDKTSENILLTFSAAIIDESFCPTGDPDYLLWVLYEGIQKAKKNRNSIRIIYPKEVTNFLLNRKLMLDVIDSIKNENMKLGLHGIYDLNNESILFKEALARIQIKDTTIEAEKFIKIISKTDIEEKLDRLMVKKVFEYIKEKQPEFKISINLSSNFMQDSFSWFIDRLKFYDIKASSIVVELTEREDITEIPEIEEKILILHKRGIPTFIDDFGVKYANYEMLRKLPVSGIKLEGSIVENIENNTLDKHFVTYAIKLAREKDLKLVAEFIETENTKKILKEMADRENFDKLYGQGFLFEKVKIVQ